ncbi:MAG: FAD-binding oxidoreductase, partial [Mycobacterium sp.]|nr:FAD-binding oxidoreductase [Mycobacterium sp.]
MTALPELLAQLGESVVATDPDILASYRQDWAKDPAAGTPIAVVRPTSTEQIQTVLRWASAHR